MEKIKVNECIIAGEIVDFLNVKDGVSKAGVPWFKYTLRIQTDKETSEYHDVDFFEMRDTFNGKENGRYKAMVTVYEESKAIATDGEGDIIRVVGRLATESYVSKTENKIVNKLIVKGVYMNRKKEGEKEKTEGYFDPVAIFKGVMFVDKMEELEDKLVITGVVNEYKSKKATVGHRVEFICDEPASIEGTKSLVKVDDVANIGAYIKDIVEVKFLPEEETKELPLREIKGFGTAVEDAKRENERIEKENARRKELRENGLQIHKQGLVVSGSSGAYTKQEIEENDMPFADYDINDMLDGIEDKMADLEAQLTYDNMNEDIPF